MNPGSMVYIAGHRGLVGSAILRRLQNEGYYNFVLKSHDELDLTNQHDTNDFFRAYNPEYVFLSAAMVGGIKANNTRSAEFIYSNLHIQCNVIDAAAKFGVKKLMFMGSSCVYPRNCPQPIREESLLCGRLEPTNEAYAIAKIAGIIMCNAYRKQYGCNFISVMPTNLYGPGDTYDLDKSHVLPAMIKKFHDAKISGDKYVEIWGTGKPMREFLFSDDLAEACVMLMERYNDSEIINIGCGEEIQIKELAYMIKDIVGFTGEIKFNTDMPDGTPRKLLDSSRINDLKWKSKTSLYEGIRITYEDFKARFA